MIRTSMVELSAIQGIAYRQKLKSGGSGITIIRYDRSQPAIATIDKRSGKCVPYKKYDANDFPDEAFNEAIELTQGLPYGKKSALRVQVENAASEEIEEPVAVQEIATIDSMEYQAVVDAFTDKKGMLSYELINKDFIKMAKKSKAVSKMIGEGAKVEEIYDYVLLARLVDITKKELSIGQVNLIINLLD